MTADGKGGAQGKKVPKLQLQVDDRIAAGQYVNFVMLNHTPTEFVLDMVFMQPGQPRGKIVARAILAPANAKRLLMALGENVKRFEDKFGQIPVSQNPKVEPVVH